MLTCHFNSTNAAQHTNQSNEMVHFILIQYIPQLILLKKSCLFLSNFSLIFLSLADTQNNSHDQKNTLKSSTTWFEKKLYICTPCLFTFVNNQALDSQTQLCSLIKYPKSVALTWPLEHLKYLKNVYYLKDDQK